MGFEADLSFPPLFQGEALKAPLDPFAKAVALAGLRADPGLIVYSEDQTAAKMAVILAPETLLRDAIGVVCAASLGLSDALGALAPPEVAVHFTWDGRYKVNGALCGAMRVAASTNDPMHIPDWLVIGLEIPITPNCAIEPGTTPDETALVEEGCADITAQALIESWSRHMLYWINRFTEEGFAPIHKNWCGKCDQIGTVTEGGTFVGLDERGGMLLRDGTTTTVRPLTSILQDAP